jgi:dTDP-4-amino-4,6-dideoxygalactose transaminase
VRGITPDALKARLKQEYNITLGGTVYDLPLHEQPAFRAYAQGALPVAEDLCRRHICPPIYPDLSDEQVAYVGQALREVLCA